MGNPTISIVVSTYNRGQTFLPNCLKSIKNQSFNDYEVIVVDDASTDNTKEVVSGFKDVKYIRLPKNTGSDTKPKNTGALEAKGRYLMFVDDDVTLRVGCLYNLHTAITKHDVDVVYGDMVLIFPDGRQKNGIRHDFDHQLLLHKNYIDTSSALMRKESFFDVGGIDETLPRFIDWNLWVRMMKAGKTFKRVPIDTFNYFIHQNTKSAKVKTDTYMHPELGKLFIPTFDPAGCKWHVGKVSKKKKPKVGIFTMHYNRLEYSKITYKEMKKTAGYQFRWYALDQGSKDGTKEWLESLVKEQDMIGMRTYCLNKNVGITKASNMLVGEMLREGIDIIIKIDNDVEFLTYGWLKDIVDLWERNTMLYVSPYVEGLIHNPGGAPRRGYGVVGKEYIEITNEIGGIFSAVDARAYKDFKWEDQMIHGNQDMEASHILRRKGYMCCYYPKHIIKHRDTTIGQMEKYKDYFERRKHEKITKAS